MFGRGSPPWCWITLERSRSPFESATCFRAAAAKNHTPPRVPNARNRRGMPSLMIRLRVDAPWRTVPPAPLWRPTTEQAACIRAPDQVKRAWGSLDLDAQRQHYAGWRCADCHIARQLGKAFREPVLAVLVGDHGRRRQCGFSVPADRSRHRPSRPGIPCL